MDQKELSLLGVSFRTAPAAVREALSFNESQAASLLRQSRARTPELEAAILSTCNRTEFYLAAPPGGSFAQDWLVNLRQLRPSAEILRADCLRYQETETAAARHLFGVACGLDSAILGDTQILGQVKRAMGVAAECGTLGSDLRRIFDQSIRAGKRARKETTIGWGAATIGSVLAGMIAGNLSVRADGRAPRILIIGAGKVARDVARHLTKRGVGNVTIINRTFTAAVELANDCRGSVLAWSELESALGDCDYAVATTSSTRPVLRRELLNRVMVSRQGRPIVIVDAGMPRNVESGAQVELIDIDAIREREEHYLAKRRAAVPDVQRIVEEEVKQWERWRASVSMERVIETLYRDVSCHSRNAAQRLVESGPLTEANAEHLIRRSFKQLLHHHVQRLRQLSNRRPIGDRDPYIPSLIA
jgi:glutamyl-tRNA reductase